MKRYLGSVKAFAKLVMDNYIGPEGGSATGSVRICRPVVVLHRHGWLPALVLHEETGDERYLRAGRAPWSGWCDRTSDKPSQSPSSSGRRASFLLFRVVRDRLRRLAPDGPSYQLAQGQLAEAVAWMKEHPITQGPGDWETSTFIPTWPGWPYLNMSSPGSSHSTDSSRRQPMTTWHASPLAVLPRRPSVSRLIPGK